MQDDGIGTYPRIALDDDGLQFQRFAGFRIHRMVLRYQADLGANHCTILDGDATEVQEGTGVVDEHVFAEADMPPEIGVERHKNRRASINLLPGHFAQPLPYLVGAGGSIERHGQLHRVGNGLEYPGIFGVVHRDGLPGEHSFENVFFDLVHVLLGFKNNCSRSIAAAQNYQMSVLVAKYPTK